jgi:hypothetical protein
VTDVASPQRASANDAARVRMMSGAIKQLAAASK